MSDAVGRGPLPPAQGGTPFVGVVDLDLSQNHLSDGCVDHLVEEIRHDTALRQLTLDSCLLSRCQLRAVLCALTGTLVQAQLQVHWYRHSYRYTGTGTATGLAVCAHRYTGTGTATGTLVQTQLQAMCALTGTLVQTQLQVHWYRQSYRPCVCSQVHWYRHGPC